MFRKAVTEVKAQVPISVYCADTNLVELKPAGLRLVGLCPFHTENTPSFTVYADSSYHCFGCGENGDVIDLHAYVDGHERPWTAVRDLAERYNVELPQRPKSWHAWQRTKGDRHKMARDALTKAYQRRFFKIYSGYLDYIVDPEECKKEAERFWDDIYPMARAAATERVMGRG